MDIKVLWLCTENPHYIIGGMGEHAKYMAENLYDKVDKFDYVCFDPGEGVTPYPLHQPGYKILGDRPGGYASYEANQTVWLMEAIRAYDGHNIIHAHDWIATQVADRLKYLYPDVKIVHTWHLYQTDVLNAEGEKPQLEQMVAVMMENYGLQNADRNIVCSNAMLKSTCENYGYEGDVDIIYNGIDFDKWNKIPYEKGLRAEFPDKPLVGFTSRMATQKGVNIIADHIENDDTYCYVMMCRWFDGQNEEDIPVDEHRNIKRFEDLRKKYPDRIRFTGFKSGDARLPYMGVFDKIVLPSLTEPWAIAGVEALASGKPLITTAVGGIGEYANQGTAWIMRDFSWQELKRCLDQSDDSKVLAGFNAAMEYTWSEAAKQTINVYNEVLK